MDALVKNVEIRILHLDAVRMITMVLAGFSVSGCLPFSDNSTSSSIRKECCPRPYACEAEDAEWTSIASASALLAQFRVIQCAGDTGRPDILGIFIQFRKIEIRRGTDSA
jgi:hypothetical protein